MVPARARIDPRGLESALSNAFILERVAPRVARFRLAGTHLSDLMGMEVRGMPLTALMLPDARDFAGEMLERAFDGPARVTLTLTGERGIGRGPMEARMALFPLIDEEGRVSRVLGALQAQGAVGRQPRRFAIVEARADAVAGPSGPQPQPQPAPGFAEPAQAAFGWRRPDGRPALRVVRDGD